MVVSNLPSWLTPFIGRQNELAEISRLLTDPACRLLTLVGSGGIGKTRLAVEAAKSQQGTSANGVHLVALQALSSPDFIVPAIADAIHLQFYPGGEPKQQLLDYLREKSLLLLLDNFEHLLDGVGLVSEMLAYAPGVKTLTTSRERLNLVEEWVLNVEGLPVPSSNDEIEIGNYSAVQLFLKSAQRVQVGFTLTDARKPAVTRICRLVGGMPLGIELASAWVRALSCEEIAVEIEHSLDILTTSARNVPPRHRNMRAVLEHSWTLLTDTERDVQKKLSVFWGGFRKEAAQAVVGATLQTLSALVDKSLLRVDSTGRYEIHELLRQYGEEQLNASPDESIQVNELHCTYYAEFLYQRWELLRGPRQKQTLEEIEVEVENLRASWRWAVEHKKQETIGHALASLWFLYDTRGWYHEGVHVFRLAVEVLTVHERDKVQSVIVGKLVARLGAFYFSLCLPEEARLLLQDSWAIFNRHGSRADIAEALFRLGELAMYLENDYPSAQQYLQESLALYQEVGDQQGAAYAVAWLGMTAYYQGDFLEAKRLGEESFALCAGLGSLLQMAMALIVLGSTAIELGEYEEAKRLGEESLAISQEIGIHYAMNHALILLGDATCALEEYSESRRYFGEAVKITKEDSFYVPLLLVGIARLLAEIGQKERAVMLLGLSLHHTADCGMGKHIGRRLRAKLEAELPQETFTMALEGSKRLGSRKPMREFLIELTRSLEGDTSLPSQSTIQSLLEPLTKRELEILCLIADGLSNQDIADRLILSLGTVKWYTGQIYSKLGVQNRAQAVIHAQQLNLLS